MIWFIKDSDFLNSKTIMLQKIIAIIRGIHLMRNTVLGSLAKNSKLKISSLIKKRDYIIYGRKSGNLTTTHGCAKSGFQIFKIKIKTLGSSVELNLVLVSQY
jgi:hypothetical protein